MLTISTEEYQGMFSFDREKSLAVGVERECFLLRNGNISPIAPEVLAHLTTVGNGRACCYGYELSACQLEDRTEYPCRVEEACDLLLRNEDELRQAEQTLGFSRRYCGVGPEDMPLDHYPVDRYDRIVSQMTEEALRAACRVTGVHVHIGMPDKETALGVYNRVIRYFPMLCQIGCVHFDRRLDNYQIVADFMDRNLPQHSRRIRLFLDHLTNGVSCPPSYQSWDDFFSRAVEEGFADDPRLLWDFIRISKYGTIEFRVFDSTDDLDLIVFWASLCQSLCKTAMAG
jgi:glutamate---cysteine ligase / carboxylate-amine ligase